MPASMRLRVAGSSSSVPRPGRACSCYLIQTADRGGILLDFGTGAFAKLRITTNYAELDAIVISHMHADHFLDLIPMRYGLRYGPSHRSDRLPLWLPPGAQAQLRDLTKIFTREGPDDFLDSVFDVRKYDPQASLMIADVRLTFAKTVHYIDAYAIRAEHARHSIVYSADTAPCEAVEELAHSCDLFLCEASLGLASEYGPERGHCSAREAGEMARRANVQRLMLTHYGSEYAASDLVSFASETYDGIASVADDGDELAL